MARSTAIRPGEIIIVLVALIRGHDASLVFPCPTLAGVIISRSYPESFELIRKIPQLLGMILSYQQPPVAIRRRNSDEQPCDI